MSKKDYSLMDYASFFFNDISKLAKSKYPYKKKTALKILLFFCTGTFALAFAFQGNQTLEPITAILHLFLAGLIFGAISLGLTKLFIPLFDSAGNDDFAQNVTISTLFLSLSFAISGFILQSETLIWISSILVISSILLLYPILAWAKLPVKQKAPLEKSFGLWSFLKNLNVVIGIISGLITTISFILAFI
ncbi:MAG: hypothetical protein ACOCRX_12340 [Candidatus Woesearchaeota archaeon]